MEQTTLEEIESIVAKETWTAEDCTELMAKLAVEHSGGRKIREMLAEMERTDPDPRGTAALKIGIGRYVLCRFGEALDALGAGTDNKDRRYIQAQCLRQLKQYDRAIEELRRAVDRGWDATDGEMAIIECQALQGELAAAGKALKKLASKAGDAADYHYLRGLVDELNGFGEQACEAYDKAREIQPGHPDATFRLAFYCDLHGKEDQAIELYKECTSRPPVHANALLNLAVLYEDAGDYDAAAACLKRILANTPNHPRASLFLKDVEASKTMYFDEDQARRIAKRNAVLDIPVTDFELSVRARNCLKKMNIRSLGDLVNTTEIELLAYKNFGETSLREIKEMLTAKGLQLGQGRDQSMGASA